MALRSVGRPATPVVGSSTATERRRSVGAPDRHIRSTWRSRWSSVSQKASIRLDRIPKRCLCETAKQCSGSASDGTLVDDRRPLSAVDWLSSSRCGTSVGGGRRARSTGGGESRPAVRRSCVLVTGCLSQPIRPVVRRRYPSTLTPPTTWPSRRFRGSAPRRFRHRWELPRFTSRFRRVPTPRPTDIDHVNRISLYQSEGAYLGAWGGGIGTPSRDAAHRGQGRVSLRRLRSHRASDSLRPGVLTSERRSIRSRSFPTIMVSARRRTVRATRSPPRRQRWAVSRYPSRPRRGEQLSVRSGKLTEILR